MPGSLENLSTTDILKNVDAVGDKYDVWLFEGLSIYMKIEVIENHEVVFCKDVLELYE